jgi:predicted TIM-barrel fold metal-dependent hydrolase
VNRPDLVADDAEITETSVWEMKGPGAPSAADLTRRPAVLDKMGIERQLIFPTFGLYGFVLRSDPNAHRFFGFDPSEVDGRAIGGEMIDIHNRWVARITSQLGDRVRPVAVLQTESLEQVLNDIERLIATGVRAVMIPGGKPPAGMSPADRRLDPLWEAIAEANLPVLHHVVTERDFLNTTVWGDQVEELRPAGASDAEFVIDPWRTATVHYAAENFVATMILGGVFERYPGLRFGTAELTAHWIGPLAERLDTVVDQFSSRYAGYSMRPSERIAANVRVSPFSFEPIDRYLERYPIVQDVLCYSSDFPHREGGAHSKAVLHERIAHLGQEVARGFFVDNGSLLVPA